MSLIRLHEAKRGQGLSFSASESQRRQRLHLFPGRALGEGDFRLMQAYADGRVEDLLEHRPPGIVSGLRVHGELDPSEASITVEPGLALGGDGRSIRLYGPLRQRWADLVEDHKERLATVAPVDEVHGLYFVTVRRQVERVDRSDLIEPCVRTETDPLRDERIETVVSLGLQPIEEGDAIVADAATDQTLTVNRRLASFIAGVPDAGVAGAIPIAMVAVEHDDLLWVDGLAGRFPATTDRNYAVFAAHTQAAFAQALASAPAEATPAEVLAALQLDYLPAAGQMPLAILQNHTSAAMPEVAFWPPQMRLELLPVPEGAVDGLVARELSRGVIDLTASAGAQVRLLLALPDSRYREDLMDLPDADHEIEADLYRAGHRAYGAFRQWETVRREIVNGLPESERQERKAPGPIARPVPAAQYFTELLAEPFSVRSSGATGMPAPYVATPPAPPASLPSEEPVPAGPAEGLLAQLTAREDEEDALEGFLEDLDKLLNDFGDGLRLQRQHLDSISISFAQLAGGVPGDGTGLRLTRVMHDMQLKNFIDPNGGTNTGGAGG